MKGNNIGERYRFEREKYKEGKEKRDLLQKLKFVFDEQKKKEGSWRREKDLGEKRCIVEKRDASWRFFVDLRR